MKRIATMVTVAVLALLTAACIPSVHPFFLDKDIVFEPQLVGEWRVLDSDNDPQEWHFEKGETEAYLLTVKNDEGQQGQFDATLFNLGDHHFLDLTPREVDYASNQADLVGLCMIPGHLLIHVNQIEPTLSMSFIDFDWLGDYLEEHPKALEHRRDSEDIVVLTAGTKELQKFVKKHVRTGELFSDYGELKRLDGDG